MVVMAKTTNIVLYFPFMVGMSQLEFCLAFANILAMAFSAGHKIYEKITVTSQILFYLVSFSGICAGKKLGLFNFWASYFTLVTFKNLLLIRSPWPSTLIIDDGKED